MSSTFRRWRQQISDDNGTGNDFITSSAWESIEMNFIALLKLTEEENGSKVTLLNSQNCEQFFGAMRTQSTQGQFGAAFDLKRAMEIIHNTHVKQVLESKLKDKFVFSKKTDQAPYFQPAPMTCGQIEETILRAYTDLKEDFAALGVISNEANVQANPMEVQVIAMKNADQSQKLLNSKTSNFWTRKLLTTVFIVSKIKNQIKHHFN